MSLLYRCFHPDGTFLPTGTLVTFYPYVFIFELNLAKILLCILLNLFICLLFVVVVVCLFIYFIKLCDGEICQAVGKSTRLSSGKIL